MKPYYLSNNAIALPENLITLLSPTNKVIRLGEGANRTVTKVIRFLSAYCFIANAEHQFLCYSVKNLKFLAGRLIYSRDVATI